MNKLKHLWSGLRSSLWFIPVLMVAGGLGLAVGLVEADSWLSRDLLTAYPRIFGAGAAGSRGMLSAIASSMITVAGLTFSLTVVAMAQASSQYTSRILRNFMRDRKNQFVLGFFVTVFAYCLVVLRTIRGGEGSFIPSMAVLFGLVLAIASVLVLIFFIHHIANSIQASSIISSAAEETLLAVERLFPQEIGREAEKSEEDEVEAALSNRWWYPVRARKTGYVQSVDADALVRFAREHACVVRMERGIGEFVVKDCPLVSLSFARTGDDKIDDEAVRQLNELYAVSHFRTIDQDTAFGIRQLVDIALKALSPGVNDTTTAVVCIDYLGAVLSKLAGRRIEEPYRFEGGEVRVIARGPTFKSLAREAFDQIRDAAAGNASIYLRLLGAIETTARQTTRALRRETLSAQVELIAKEADRMVESNYNRERVRERIAETLSKLKLSDNMTPESSIHP